MNELRRRIRQNAKDRGRHRRAVVLVVVLVVVAILSLGAYTFTDLMVTQDEASRLLGQRTQARVLVDSGVEAMQWFLSNDVATQADLGGAYNNPIYFQAVTVVSDVESVTRGNFTVLAPALDEEAQVAGVRYGLADESTRLNLNTLLLADDYIEGSARGLLLALPGMTDEIADAILDWMDDDDEPREYGVELEYYTKLVPAYAPKNGPLETVEELLLVRGVTPELLFGLDGNRNGIMDMHEQSADNELLAAIDTTTTSPLGWSQYLTLYSKEKNVTSDGDQRINLNQEDLESLHEELSEVFSDEWVTYIIAYRQNGPYTGDDEAQDFSGGEIDLTTPAQHEFVQVLDLIGGKVRARLQDAQESIVLRSPFSDALVEMATYLPLLIDKVTVNPSKTIPGRININQVSRELLIGVPGMTEEIADQIIELREVDPAEQPEGRQHETWLLTEAVVTLDQMRTLSPYINAGGNVHRAQIVGYFEDGAASSRAEVVFDATEAKPKIVLWRDISHLGRGFDLATLGMSLVEESTMPGR